jgi:hypothetical protein
MLTAALFLLAGAQPSFARVACPHGGYTTVACKRALSQMTDKADDLSSCLNMLQSEYNGQTGNGVGKGAAYDRKKAQCVAIARNVLSRIVTTASSLSADENAPREDTSPQSAINAVARWKM